MTDHHRLNLRAARASVAVALLLIVIKALAFYSTSALSIAASLIDSGLDLCMSVAAIFAISYAARPPDDDHAFGHSSAEDLVSLFQALVLLISAGGLIWTAWSRFTTHEAPTLHAEATGIIAMVLSMGFTLALVLWQGHIAAQTGNKVVAADRLHYLADLLPAGGSILALLASKLWGIWQIDAVVAGIAAIVLIRGGFSIGAASWNALMDRRADEAVERGIAEIATGWPGVRGWHDLKTRTAGSRIFAHLHIELDGDQPLHQAHDIGASLRRAIREAYPQVDVIIHKDVAGEDMAGENMAGEAGPATMPPAGTPHTQAREAR